PPAKRGAGMRLDERLVRDGFAETRARAQAAVLAGRVTVDGAVVDKPGRWIAPEMRVKMTAPAHPYVGRGGVKLAHALESFGIQVRGRAAIDLGASTGGFTDCLLRAGAARVYAVDVGHGQLAWTLRQDPRVVVMEDTNARGLTPGRFAGPVDLVTADLSFISLRLLWGVIASLVRPDGDVVVLVKPQFEAGRTAVGRGGVVRDPAVHSAVLEDVLAAAARDGLAPRAVTASPITGPAGNIEYLVHLRRLSSRAAASGASPPSGASRRDAPALPDIAAAIGDAHRRFGHGA
ncbi:MAG TPA: TlyA family RNA methyltransferase, partial [bacterium]|nr:TlyA family RNA methyltransferase [bacterium]